MAQTRLQPITRVRGRFAVPGDKSISHRALLLGALAGSGRIRGLAPGRDVGSTRAAVTALGARISDVAGGVRVVRPARWRADEPIDCGNSGTTARLLLGLLAARAERPVTLIGDRSLSDRPMARVTQPLVAMGAAIEERGPSDRLPIEVVGRPLAGGVHRLAVASAQVKSALLLAGLEADGETVVLEPGMSRDHTERMLAARGVEITWGRSDPGEQSVRLRPGRPAPLDVDVPGDLSSAAPFLTLAACRPGSDVTIEDVGLNPGRTGIVEILAGMGADVEVEVDRADPEPRGRVRVRGRELQGIGIDPAIVPRAIDELPLVAVLGCAADGETRVEGAAELRLKESDRIATITAGLRAMGAEIEISADGFRVRGPRPLEGATLDAAGDHRIGMALAVAAGLAGGPSTLTGTEWIAVSYPAFLETLAGCVDTGRAA